MARVELGPKSFAVQATPTDPWRLAGHGRLECSCGAVLVQCRCPEHSGRVQVAEQGCPRCRVAPSAASSVVPAALKDWAILTPEEVALLAQSPACERCRHRLCLHNREGVTERRRCQVDGCPCQRSAH